MFMIIGAITTNKVINVFKNEKPGKLASAVTFKSIRACFVIYLES